MCVHACACVCLQVMQLSSSPLAGLRELRIHMLGAVQLPQGGLPCLPSLTHLEFYLPDERNWGANARVYFDNEGEQRSQLPGADAGAAVFLRTRKGLRRRRQQLHV